MANKNKPDQQKDDSNQKNDQEKNIPFKPTFPTPNGPEIVDPQAQMGGSDHA